MEANKIQVIDDQGNEKEFEVLFTFNNEELGKQYVLYYDTTVEEPSVFASIYDDAGQLLPPERLRTDELLIPSGVRARITLVARALSRG